jgi:hypothetical protein
MLRATSTFLSRFPQRALPFPALHAPGSIHDVRGLGALQLHVFARRRNADHADVEVGDGASVAVLKDAVIAKLKLDAAPDHVRLLREVEGGGAPVLLVSRRKLAEQSVLEGSCVLVEVMEPAAASSAAALPAPLTFAEECLGGEPMMVASLPLTHSVAAPFYLTPLQHYGLMRFLREPSSIAPQMLMLTGPVKSGKSRIVHDVIPLHAGRTLRCCAHHCAPPRDFSPHVCSGRC